MEIEKIKACMKCNHVQLTRVTILEELPCMPYEWYQEKDIFERHDVFYCPECHIIYRIQKKWYYSKKIWTYLKSFIYDYEEVEQK